MGLALPHATGFEGGAILVERDPVSLGHSVEVFLHLLGDGTMRPGRSRDTLAGLPSAAACDRLPYAASYNPHKCGSFTFRVGGCVAETRALRAASQTLFTPAGVTVSNPA